MELICTCGGEVERWRGGEGEGEGEGGEWREQKIYMCIEYSIGYVMSIDV